MFEYRHFFLRRWTGISSYKLAPVVEVDDTDFIRKGPSKPRLCTILCCFLLLGVDAPRSVYVEYIQLQLPIFSSIRIEICPTLVSFIAKKQ
jgi:hypothetical protein